MSGPHPDPLSDMLSKPHELAGMESEMTVVQFQPRPTPSQEWLAGEMALVRIPEHWGPGLTAAARAALEALLLAQINPPTTGEQHDR